MQTSGILHRVEGTEFNGCHDDWDKFDSLESYINFTRQWLNQCKRLLKPNASIWVIGSMQCIYIIGSMMQELGFWIINDVIWHKTNPAPKIYKNGFLNSCEMIICMWNKGHKWNFTKQNEMHNFFESPICMYPERLREPKHPAQKPVKLLKHIINIASNPDDIVFDPFMGVGSTGVACMELGRRFVGCEIDKVYFNAAKKRISAYG